MWVYSVGLDHRMFWLYCCRVGDNLLTPTTAFRRVTDLDLGGTVTAPILVR